MGSPYEPSVPLTGGSFLLRNGRSRSKGFNCICYGAQGAELSGVIRANRKFGSFVRSGLTRYKNRGFDCERFARIDSRESRCESPVPLIN